MTNDFIGFAASQLRTTRMHIEKFIGTNTPRTLPTVTNFTPSVIEERQLNVTQMDVFSRLMMDRVIFMGRPVDDYIANVIQAQLLFLDSVDNKKDISLYINSPGGSVTAGLGIYDTMQYVTPDVATICTGMAASMAATLLAAGAKGKRTALEHSRIMIHQPSGGMRGQVSEMEISYNLIKSMQRELNEILSKHTGQAIEQIVKDSDRDHWMKAAIAKEYGMVDEVIVN
ncbi:MAG: ClpP family protease [Saprospiraceae bacterium]